MIDSPSCGYVVSDLHLFTHRTTAAHHMDELRDAVGRADFFVLNGDIFDFRWSTLGSLDETAHAAVDGLSSVAAEFPHCRFFYIMGNHDGLEFFADHLDALAARTPNFRWHPSHLRIGNTLFLHGDLALDGACPDPFVRPLLPTRRIRGGMLNFAYRLLIALGLHRLAPHLHGRRRCAKRILRCLREHHPALAEGIQDVYFGHIHKPFSNFRYDGVTFHNTGSSVQGLRCSPLAVRA